MAFTTRRRAFNLLAGWQDLQSEFTVFLDDLDFLRGILIPEMAAAVGPARTQGHVHANPNPGTFADRMPDYFDPLRTEHGQRF